MGNDHGTKGTTVFTVPLSKIARHLERKHIEIKDVAYAFSFPVKSKERKILLDQL